MPDAPVLLVVDDHPQGRDVVEGELRKRYGDDYQVIRSGLADDPLGLLGRLGDDRRLVAMVLAGEGTAGTAGTELLARAGGFHRTARRLLLTDGGFGPPSEPILRAIALGHIDAYTARPVTVPDERFHLAVTELLEEWARSHRPRFEVVRVVGEEWSARSHEIRDLMDRNSVPFGFYPASTDEGQALLQAAGAGAALPVIILFDGRALANPANTEIAEALGLKTRPGGDRCRAGRPGRGGLRGVRGPVDGVARARSHRRSGRHELAHP